MTMYTRPQYSVTSSLSTLNAITSSQNSYLARNDKRAGLIMVMTGSSRAYVAYSDTVSPTFYTYTLDEGDTVSESVYNGPISVVFSSTTGSLQFTQILYGV